MGKKKTRPDKTLTNLFKEIKASCKIDDIDYVVIHLDRWGDNSRHVRLDTEWFLDQAKRIDYDDGYGGNVIDLGLTIVLKDGRWLERTEYDGAEGFSLKGRPACPDEMAPKDIAVILQDKHGCPYNQATIDGQSINKRGERLKDDGYHMWFDKDGKIVTESFKWVDGNYRKAHQKLMK